MRRGREQSFRFDPKNIPGTLRQIQDRLLFPNRRKPSERPARPISPANVERTLTPGQDVPVLIVQGRIEPYVPETPTKEETPKEEPKKEIKWQDLIPDGLTPTDSGHLRAFGSGYDRMTALRLYFETGDKDATLTWHGEADNYLGVKIPYSVSINASNLSGYSQRVEKTFKELTSEDASPVLREAARGIREKINEKYHVIEGEKTPEDIRKMMAGSEEILPDLSKEIQLDPTTDKFL